METKKDALGQFELLVLCAVSVLGDNAYGIAIANKVEELARRQVILGAVYLTLDRLEEKKYLKSRYENLTPELGGREKRYFRLLPSGERAMNEALDTAERIVRAIGRGSRKNK